MVKWLLWEGVERVVGVRRHVGGSRPGGCGGVKTPPYDAKDTWAVMARWRAGHARPLRGGVNGLRTGGTREGGSPPLPSWRVVDRERAATQGPSESPSPLTRPAPLDKGASTSPLRGFGGTPEFKVEEGAGGFRTKRKTAFVLPPPLPTSALGFLGACSP